ncbi:MAG: MlaD family protein, partial [Gemmatimonadaceae bacterium]
MRRATFITWEQLRVGLLILLALLILSVAIFKLGEAANLFSSRYRLVALLPSAAGLLEGGSVTVAGQLAGSVSRIEFLPPDGDSTRNLRVVVEIDQSLQPQIREDSEARLRTMGLLGDKVLDISPGTPRAAV